MVSLRPIVVFSLVAFASILIGLSVGSVSLSFSQLANVLSGADAGVNADIIFGLRLPRVLAGFACGGLLALAGVLLQALLRNPLADPFILGVSSGASLAGLLAVVLGLSAPLISGAAFAGAAAAIGAVFGLSFRARGWQMENLLLTGVVISAGFGALIILLLALAPANDVRGMLFWLMGDLSHAGSPWLALLVLAACAAIALYFAPSLDVLSLGDAKARSLGVFVTGLQAAIYFCAAAACAAAVMTAGAIGFVGLIAPHAVRLLGISTHRPLIIAAMLLGGTVVVLADMLARSVIAPQQLPVGVLLALLGVPAMLWLLWKQR
jgi:iron complex transport system permease protein